MSRTQIWASGLLIWLLAFVLDFGYFAVDSKLETPDSRSYLVAAEHMVEGLGFTNEALEPETRRTPVYPVFIAIFLDMGLTPEALVVVQHLVRSLIAAGLFLLTLHLVGEPLIALGAGVVFALDFSSVVLANRVMSETLFTAALLFLFWMAVTLVRAPTHRWLLAFLVGLFGGFTVLIRPISLFFFVPLGLFLLLTLGKRAALPLVMMCSAFPIYPTAWAVHNRNATGVATVSSISADNLLRYRAAGVLALETPGDFTSNLHEYQERLTKRAQEEGRRKYGDAFDALPHAVRAEVYTRVAMETLLEHPLSLVPLTARGVVTALLGGGAAALAEVTGLSQAAARRLVLVYTLPCLVFALLGIGDLFRRRRDLCYLIFFFLAYFVGISAGAEAYSRFRVPVMPMYAMAVAAGLYSAWNRFMVRHEHRAGNVPAATS